MAAGKSAKETFEPQVAGFICQECCDECPEKANLDQLDFAANLIFMTHVCAATVEDAWIREAFAQGADGVLICGCLVGNCGSGSDNLSTLSRIHHGASTLSSAGIRPDRLRREWVCAPGGDSLAGILREFIEHLRELGPHHEPVPASMAEEA
jgi:F420-non-reducing hydrogenase iron-sulfur subunit